MAKRKFGQGQKGTSGYLKPGKQAEKELEGLLDTGTDIDDIVDQDEELFPGQQHPTMFDAIMDTFKDLNFWNK